MKEESEISKFKWAAMIVFGVAAIYAPLHQGARIPVAVKILDGILLVGVLLMVCGYIADRDWPKLRPLAWILPMLLAILALCHAANPRFVFDEKKWEFQLVPGAIGWLPGTAHLGATMLEIWHLGALGLTFWVLCDAFRNHKLRWFLLGWLGLAGIMIACIGIWLKISGSRTLFLAEIDIVQRYFFASFRHHGNGAAYINLVWPICLGLALRRCMSEKGAGGLGGIWLAGTFFTISAMFVNNSKGGHLLAIPGLLFAIILFGRPMVYVSSWSKFMGAIVLALAIALLLAFPTMSRSIFNWDFNLATLESGQGSIGHKLLALKGMVRVLPESGWWGFGPGTFAYVYPYYTDGLALRGFLNEAHQDYMQTIIDWGYVGAGLWFLLFAGAFVNGIKSLVKKLGPNLSIRAGLLALTLICLHAFGDFPFQVGCLQYYAAVHLALLWTKER